MDKKQWYPVHSVDSGRITDFIVMAGDPINGEFVGCYADMGTAHYVSRIHNNHVSTNMALREVDLMFQSEIHFGIIGHWDGGIEWFLGWDYRTATTKGNEATMEVALAAMVNAARVAYPASVYASLFPSNITIDPDLTT